MRYGNQSPRPRIRIAPMAAQLGRTSAIPTWTRNQDVPWQPRRGRVTRIYLGNPDADAFRCRGRPLCLPIRIAPAATLKKGRHRGLPLRTAQSRCPGQPTHALRKLGSIRTAPAIPFRNVGAPPWIAHRDSPCGYVEEGQTQGSAPTRCVNQDVRGDPHTRCGKQSPRGRRYPALSARGAVATILQVKESHAAFFFKAAASEPDRREPKANAVAPRRERGGYDFLQTHADRQGQKQAHA